MPAFFLLLLICAAPAAQTEWVNPAAGDWLNSANWTMNQLPTSTIDAVVANGGTALLNAAGASAQQLLIGVVGTGGSTGTVRLGATSPGGLTISASAVVGSSFTTGMVGTGLLEVLAGSSLTQNGGNFAIGGGTQASNGTVRFAGMNTFASLRTVTVGSENSTGNWNVENGAVVSTGGAQIGATLGATGTATVTGTGAYWSLANQLLEVGPNGSGTMNILNGGVVANGDATIARNSGSMGTVTVSGTNAFWYCVYNLYVGGSGASGANGGIASLQLLNGGAVQASVLKVFGNSSVEVNNGSTANPGLYISDLGPTPVAGGDTGPLTVGTSGAGRMVILNGGMVMNGVGTLGRDAMSAGSVRLTDANSRWTTSDLVVGKNGVGTLEVVSNSLVSSSGNSSVAMNAGSTGDVFVNTGGTWTTIGNLYLGGGMSGAGGAGTLHIAGAQVNAGPTLLYANGGLSLGASPVLNTTSLTSNGGFVRLEANTSLPNDFNIASGGLRFETAGFSGSFGGAFSGVGGLTKAGGPVAGAGTLTLTGTSNYAGATDVSNGTLLVNGSITSAVTVNATATLGGTGSVGSVTVNSGGTVAPGTSVGTLTINGNYNQTSNGALNIELGGTTPGSGFDRLLVSGPASVSGMLNVTLVNGFRPSVGDSFKIITSNGESGNFTSINATGFIAQSNVSPTGVTLNIVAVYPPFLITDIKRMGNDVVITFMATAGATYRLERKANLLDPMWSSAGVTDITPASNGLAQFTMPNDIPAGHAFYRVTQVSAPPQPARAGGRRSP